MSLADSILCADQGPGAMKEPHPTRRIGRSVLALFAGFVFVVGLTLITDLVLHRLGFFPPAGQPAASGSLMVAILYRCVYGIAGAWLTARLAPYKPMQHALLGGAIGTAVAILGAVATWNGNLGPHWYPIALVLTALPCAWLGGKIS